MQKTAEATEAMWLMMQTETPGDYVLASGRTATVRDFVRWAFAAAGIEIVFEGAGLQEVGRDSKTGHHLVTVSPRFYRAVDANNLCGDSSKAKQRLGWDARVGAKELASLMVEADLAR